MQGFCSTTMAAVWTIYLMAAATHSSWVWIMPIAISIASCGVKL